MLSSSFLFKGVTERGGINKDDAIRVFYVDFRIQLSGSCGMALARGRAKGGKGEMTACSNGCLSLRLSALESARLTWKL